MENQSYLVVIIVYLSSNITMHTANQDGTVFCVGDIDRKSVQLSGLPTARCVYVMIMMPERILFYHSI